MELSIKAIASDPDARSAGVEASRESVLQWLSRVDGDWLLIVDNADGDPYMLNRYMPTGNVGNVLFTSRNKNVGQHVSSQENRVEVSEMAEDEAISLLLKASMLDESSVESARSIVRALHCLPLAVDQAGAFIDSGRCRISEYLDMYSTHRRRLMTDAKFKGASEYGRAVYATWEMSMAELQQRIADMTDLSSSKAAQCAMAILHIFAFLHHDDILEEIFEKAAESYVPISTSKRSRSYHSVTQKVRRLFRKIKSPEHTRLGHPTPNPLLQICQTDNWDRVLFREGISVLTSFSLIKASGDGHTYSIHPLVHSWSRDRLSDVDWRTKWHSVGALLSGSIQYGESSKEYMFRRSLVPHIKAYYQHRDPGISKLRRD